MGHHHHHHNQHHHNQQQPQQIIHKSPVALAPMDPEVPLVDNINPDSPVIALAGAGHVPLQQFKELEGECLSLNLSGRVNFKLILLSFQTNASHCAKATSR